MKVNAQTRPQIEKALKAPNAKEQSGKADVFILEKKISDSRTLYPHSKQAVAPHKKKSGCRKKGNRS